jgi:hypothetical protein
MYVINKENVLKFRENRKESNDNTLMLLFILRRY